MAPELRRDEVGPVSGPMLFARYAFPPNELGYCGPDDAAAFFSHGVRADDAGLRKMARDFDGALPYLQLIADSNRRPDVLDAQVVEAYWLGGPALDRVDAAHLSVAVRTSVAGRTGPLFASLGDALDAGALPHHSFAVFCVYPWVAMLGDPRRTPQALTVLDQCRIRWGRVVAIDADATAVESRPLTWDGRRLALGEPVIENVRRAIDGVGLSSALTEGDLVALHWDWVCDRITDGQRDALAAYSGRHLDLANSMLAGRLAVAGAPSRGGGAEP